MTRKIIFIFILINCFALLIKAQDSAYTMLDTAIAAPTDATDDYEEDDYNDEYDATNSFDSINVRHYNNINKHNDPFVQRTISNQAFNKASSPPKDFWYVHEKPKEEEQQQQTKDVSFALWLAKLLRNKTFQTIVWMLVGLIFIAIVISFVRSSDGWLFRKKGEIFNRKENDSVSENIFEIDFAKAIQKAQEEKNYSLCVRLLFLKLLKTMNEAGIIAYEKDKTNFDYLFALSGSKYFNGFAQQVRNYEFVWYGKFPIDHEKFEAIQKNFETFSKTINR
jgi:hypothetical protein